MSLARDVRYRLEEQGMMWVRNGVEYFPTVDDIQQLIDDGKAILDAQGNVPSTYFKGGVFMYRWENGKIDVYVIEGEI